MSSKKPPRPKPSRKTSAASPALQEIAALPKLFHLCASHDAQLLHENTTPLSIGTNIFLSLQKISDVFQGPAFISDTEFVANCKYVIAFLRSSPSQDITRVHQIMLVDIVENAIITFIIRIIPSLVSSQMVPTSSNRPNSPLVMISLAETVDSHILQFGDFALQLRMAAAYLLLRDSKEVQLLFSLWSSPISVSSPNLAWLDEGSVPVQNSPQLPGHLSFVRSRPQSEFHRQVSLSPSMTASPDSSLSPTFGIWTSSSSASKVALNSPSPTLSSIFNFMSSSSAAGIHSLDSNYSNIIYESISESSIMPNTKPSGLEISVKSPNLVPLPHETPSPSSNTTGLIKSHEGDIPESFWQLSDGGGLFTPILSPPLRSSISMSSGDLVETRAISKDALGIFAHKPLSSRESSSGPVAKFSSSMFGEASLNEFAKQAPGRDSNVEESHGHCYPPIVRALSQNELSRVLSGYSVSNNDDSYSESTNEISSFSPTVVLSQDGLPGTANGRVLESESSSGLGQDLSALRSQPPNISSRLVSGYFWHDGPYSGPGPNDLPSYSSIISAASQDELPTLLSSHISNAEHSAELPSIDSSVYRSIVIQASQDDIPKLMSGNTSNVDQPLPSLLNPDPNCFSNVIELDMPIHTPAMLQTFTPNPNHRTSSPTWVDSASESSSPPSSSRKTTVDEDPFRIVTTSHIPVQSPAQTSSSNAPSFSRRLRARPRKQSSSALIMNTEIFPEQPLSFPPPATKRKRDEEVPNAIQPGKKMRGLGKSTRSRVGSDNVGTAISQEANASSPKRKRRTRATSGRIEKENRT